MTRNKPSLGQWPEGKPPQQVHDYVDWLVTPSELRDPPTKIAYARALGIDRSTLRLWENDDRVRWIIQDRADSLNMSPERVQSVMNALHQKAASGDTQAAKLYLEHVNSIMPRKAPEPVGLESLSDEELRERLKAHLSE